MVSEFIEIGPLLLFGTNIFVFLNKMCFPMLLPLPKPQPRSISAYFLKLRELFMSLGAGIKTSEGSHETQEEFIRKLMKAVQCSIRMIRAGLGQHLSS